MALSDTERAELQALEICEKYGQTHSHILLGLDGDQRLVSELISRRLIALRRKYELDITAPPMD